MKTTAWFAAFFLLKSTTQKLAAALLDVTSDVADDFITNMSMKGIPDHIKPCLVSLVTCVFATDATAFA